MKFINSFGRDVIITDHHEAPEILPDAYAIINPKAMNALDEKLISMNGIILLLLHLIKIIYIILKNLI